MLVFDTETTIDETQALLYGCFRYCQVDGLTVTTVAEGLIYADELPESDPAGYATLQAYVASHKADVDLTYLGVEPNWALELLSRTEFMNRWLWHVGYPHNNRRDAATILTFNAPFDFSRIAVDVSPARGDFFHGGFSFALWQGPDGKAAPWRPRLAIKSLDSKRAFKEFKQLERGGDRFTGHLLDLRTSVSALTGASHSLGSACAAFGVEGKAAPEFGVITKQAIAYCRKDVAATTGLYEAVATEYSTHPIDLQITAAYSPASFAKGYLRAMGIRPRLAAQPDFRDEILGYAMSAFYGGRAEVHLRHTPAPVALVDFTSMYPTVDTLMGIWEQVTAARIETVDVTDEITDLLDTITAEECFDPNLWPRIVVIAEIIPDGDVLPVRADYAPENWSIGINPLRSDQPLWYTLSDLIGSKLLSGRTPTIRRALRFVRADICQPELQLSRCRPDQHRSPSRRLLPTGCRSAPRTTPIRVRP